MRLVSGKDRRIQIAGIVAGVLILIALTYISVKSRNKQTEQDETVGAVEITPTPTPDPTPADRPTAEGSPSSSPAPTPTSNSTPSASPTNSSSGAAESAYLAKNYPLAISEYQKEISQTTDKQKLAQLWNTLGNVYRDANQLNDAAGAYEKSYGANQEFGDPYLNRAAILWKLEKRDDAISTLELGISRTTTRKTDLQNTLDAYKALNR